MFNTQVFNWFPTIVIPKVTDFAAWYGDKVLHDEVTYFSTIKYLEWKDVKFEQEQINKDEGVIFNIQEGAKIIEISWLIKKNDRGELLMEIDDLKAALSLNNQMLVVKEGDQKRQHKCVRSKIALWENHYNIAWMEFTVTFLTFDFAEDYATISDTVTISSSPYTFNISRSWTAPAKAKMILTFASATSVNQVKVSIGWTEVIINTSIVSGDVLIIDWMTKRVTKNWTVIWFNWIIPRLESSSNSTIVTINWTFSVEYLYQYHPSFR